MVEAMLACALLGLSPANALSQPAGEYEVKAAYIYNFAKFVDWPSSVGSKLRLCIVGPSPFGGALDAIRGRPVKERTLEVVQLDGDASAAGCQMLFVSAAEERNLDRIVARARGSGILLLGDGEGFAQRGIMINLYVEEGKVRFEINLVAIRRSGLNVSSKLLSLWRLVE
ncbi:MAG: YfiR family protein [Sulfuricellaceae bacterium]